MRIWLAVAAAVLATQSGLAHAEIDKLSGAPLPPHPTEKTSPILDHFYILAAFYAPAIHTDVRIDPTTGVPPGTLGTPVNAERDLGLQPRFHLGKVEFGFRMRERHRLRADYFQADRSAGHTLANTVVFGDQTFLAGESVHTTINWRSFGLSYTYSLYRSERFEVGTGLGVYFLQAEAIGQVPATGQETDKSAAEPGARRCRSISPGRSRSAGRSRPTVTTSRPRSAASRARTRTSTATCSTGGIPISRSAPASPACASLCRATAAASRGRSR
jgi:hypothetical protein